MCVVAENGERRSFVVKNACHFFATRLEKLALATPIIIICVKIHASYASRVTGDWTYVSCDRIWLMERRAPGHRYLPLSFRIFLQRRNLLSFSYASVSSAFIFFHTFSSQSTDYTRENLTCLINRIFRSRKSFILKRRNIVAAINSVSSFEDKNLIFSKQGNYFSRSCEKNLHAVLKRTANPRYEIVLKEIANPPDSFARWKIQNQENRKRRWNLCLEASWPTCTREWNIRGNPTLIRGFRKSGDKSGS